MRKKIFWRTLRTSAKPKHDLVGAKGSNSASPSAAATARSKRKGLTGELPDDGRAIEAIFAECDDYLPQFALASDVGRQFSDAWFAARQVIDLGKHAAKPDDPAKKDSETKTDDGNNPPTAPSK